MALQASPTHPTRSFARAIRLASVAAAAGTACGPPVLYDTELRPVRRPIIVAAVDHGWLAIDSTENGVRGVLELQFEGPPEAAEYVTRHLPRLHCESKGDHLPVRVRREPPSCPAPATPPPECLEGTSPERCLALREAATPACLFTVRAEFEFSRMPHLDENHYFTFGQHQTPLHWARRNP